MRTARCYHDPPSLRPGKARRSQAAADARMGAHVVRTRLLAAADSSRIPSAILPPPSRRFPSRWLAFSSLYLKGTKDTTPQHAARLASWSLPELTCAVRVCAPAPSNGFVQRARSAPNGTWWSSAARLAAKGAEVCTQASPRLPRRRTLAAQSPHRAPLVPRAPPGLTQ